MLVKVLVFASLAMVAQCNRMTVHEHLASDSSVDSAISQQTQGTYTCSCDGQQVMKMGHLAAVGLGMFPCLQKCAELGAKTYCTFVSNRFGGTSCHAVPTKDKFCVKTKCEASLTSFGQCAETFDVTEEVLAFKSKLVGSYFAREGARKCSGWCSEEQTIDEGSCPGALAQVSLAQEAGKCVEADQSIIADRKATLKWDVQKCAIGCIVSGQSCMLDCVERMGFTNGCASCWVGLATCSKSKCIWSCINPSGAKCSKCAYDSCFPALLECTGVPETDLPPP